jgi:hypothetical protein
LFELREDEGRGAASVDLDMAQLSVGELLVIWALRMRLARGASGPVCGFRLAFGLSGLEAALASFEAVFGLLRRHCRHEIGMHAPGCHCVSLDELTVASVIAALQAGSFLRAHAIAARLIDASVLDGFLDHAADLAISLQKHRLDLPLRPMAGQSASPPPIH